MHSRIPARRISYLRRRDNWHCPAVHRFSAPARSSAPPWTVWTPSNSSTGLSALSYIPEAVWNQSASVTGGRGEYGDDFADGRHDHRGVAFTVTQPGSVVCSYTVSPGPLTTLAGGYSATIAVAAPATCSWAAASDASWITIKSGGSGSGNGAATIFAASKSSGPSRSGMFVIAGYAFTLTEK
jgi:hypothetical protein